ncbi:T/G mismatch-specific endonuclease [Kytococcus aerolatus]|uniref:T/G mismatch-specific endonuclease n=1 Tax=Kytococcus aerolatus TaxID=592308 RepID=A0A212T5P7_9MICO|nr:very short patch repair endonuclease [Kytococcus aerolatus]SNC61190.1 T/G mismatch-specific endonuclease [Kytococcus aerolatus]
MAPSPVSNSVSLRMQRQRRAGTGPEMRLRRALHARGWRFRVGFKVPRAPRRTIDVAFPKRKVAVFVDGCFWHVCPEHGVRPKSNAEWWHRKLMDNVVRDRTTDEVLVAQGWVVVRVWEHAPRMEAVHAVEMALHLAESSACL